MNKRNLDSNTQGDPKNETAKRLNPKARKFVPPPAPSEDMRPTSSTHNIAAPAPVPNNDLPTSFKAQVSAPAPSSILQNPAPLSTKNGPVRRAKSIRIINTFANNTHNASTQATSYKGKGKGKLDALHPVPVPDTSPIRPTSRTTDLAESTAHQIREDHITALQNQAQWVRSDTARLQGTLADKKKELLELKVELSRKLPKQENLFKKKLKAARKVVEQEKKERNRTGSEEKNEDGEGT